MAQFWVKPFWLEHVGFLKLQASARASWKGQAGRSVCMSCMYGGDSAKYGHTWCFSDCTCAPIARCGQFVATYADKLLLRGHARTNIQAYVNVYAYICVYV